MSNEELTWKAVYTKPRNEKKVASRLADSGYEVYSPMRKTLKQWSDRKKWVEEPLFSSYVFVRVAEDQRAEVLADPGVVAFLFWLGKPAVVRNEEIQAIRDFIERHPSAQAVALSVEKGKRVAIKRGPMKNHEGVVRRSEKGRVIIEIDSMGMELIADVSKDDLIG
jgi:transcription antitermination factor NusG